MVELADLLISKWLAAFLVVATLLVIWTTSKFSYWKKKKIPYLRPNFPWGNLNNLFVSRKSIGHVYWDFYNKVKETGAKYAGFYMFTSPVFVPVDPECIKAILIKDFSNFHGRGFYNNEKDQPMSANMFTVDGSKWRTLRYKFSPIFSSGKIKYMYKLVVDCAQPLSKMVSNFSRNKKPVNMKDILRRYTTDSISSCAFGVNCNSFNDDAVMHRTVDTILEESTTFVRFAMLNTFPDLCRSLGMPLFIKKHMQYFIDVITESYEQRKKNLVHRTDFLQLMKDIQEKKNNEDFDLTLDEIRSQSFVFFLGGYETSSTVMTYLFLELAENMEIQETLRKEILDVSDKHGGITYDALHQMKYLQCVIDEALRKYPPLTVLNRTCLEDYQLPNGEILEKGTNIIIPVLGIHRDPEFYPNPDLFDPDRFSDENKATRPSYTYLPFGDGPRNCIGNRFGLIQMQVAVSHLLSKFRFTVNKNMDPTRRYTTHFILTFAGDVLLDAEEI